MAIVMTSCRWDSSPHFTTMFVNCTEDSLYIVEGYKVAEGYEDLSKDTIIIVNDRTGKLSDVMELEGEFPPLQVWPCYSSWTIRGDGRGHKMVRLFIVKIKDVQEYGWVEVAKKNMILQRYDITDFDMEKINYRISFPPSPSMVNVSMWPPYGTYSYSLP